MQSYAEHCLDLGAELVFSEVLISSFWSHYWTYKLQLQTSCTMLLFLFLTFNQNIFSCILVNFTNGTMY